MDVDISRLKPSELQAYAKIVSDVRLWAEAFLVNPTDETPFRLNHVQKKMLAPGKIHKVIRVHRRAGKCVAESDRITLADGSRICARDLIGQQFELLTMTDTGIQKVPALAEYNDTEPVYRVTTKSGRHIVRNAAHPLYTSDGKWTEVKDLNSMHYVAVPDELPCESKETMDEKDLRSLALLVRYPDSDNVPEFTELLKKHGLYGMPVEERFIPEAVFNLTRQQQRMFLSLLFTNGGWAYAFRGIHLGYCCSSRRLVEDIQELLLRFGVSSELEFMPDTEMHVLNINKSIDQVRFADRIGIPGREKSLAAITEEALSHNVDWYRKDAPENMHWEQVLAVTCKGTEATVSISVPEYHTFLTTFYEHNSYGLAVLALWYALTHDSAQVLIICPDLGKVQNIFRSIDEFLRVSPVISGELKASTKMPVIREFKNGSVIKGKTAGSSGKSQGKGIRGDTADLVIIDEAAFLSEEDWPAIDPIIQGDATRPEVMAFISSTPTADRNRYWELCTQPKFENTYDRIHVPITENPDYTPERIAEMEALTANNMTWNQEFLAAFPDIGEGVYRRSYIDRAQRAYEYTDPKVVGSIKHPAVRTMGVDWDKYGGVGPNIVILELDRENRLVKAVYHEEIDPGEYCLNLALQRIIELNALFNPQFINVDRGYGEAQVESLKLYGLNNPETGLAQKVKGISFSDKVDIIDPITKEHIKKRIKPVMVGITIHWFEENRFIYPKSHNKFTYQLQEYKIVSMSESTISYSDEDEHIIDAFMLAAYALYDNYEDPFGIEPAVTSYLLPIPEAVPESEDSKYAYGYVSEESIVSDFKRRKIPRMDYDYTDITNGLASRGMF